MSLNDKLFVTWWVVAILIVFSGFFTMLVEGNAWIKKLFMLWFAIGAAFFLFIIWTN